MAVQYWSIPKIWEGATVFILGGGPSLSLVNFELIKKRRIIAVNNAYGDPTEARNHFNVPIYTPRDWVDVVFFGDLKWYKWHRKALFTRKGLIITCNQNGLVLNNGSWLKKLKRNKKKPLGITESPSHLISWNKNSGAAAINVAYHLGAKTIVLLGFDMRLVKKKKNYHDDHQEKLVCPFNNHLKAFPAIYRDAGRLGLEIINCTPRSAIEEFPIMTLEEYLRMEESHERTDRSQVASAN